MVESVTIVSKSFTKSVIVTNNFDRELVINCSELITQSITSFTIEIVFSNAIQLFRNYDYTWVDLKSDRIANSFSPKIIKLQNGFYIQSNCNHGIWEVQKKNPKKLFWRFHPENSNPLVKYSGENNNKKIVNAQPIPISELLKLLFSEKGALELSRSQIPFVATACFTDHCDFDTAVNLEKQRVFFKENKIRTTKGFFLNHFSKRNDNASWENNPLELKKWIEDGHELCYHSLSQSIKSKEESVNDFKNFIPPIKIQTWIDHGYQPYNLSLYQKEKIEETLFSENVSSKGITIMWNYIDSGTATECVINQLNTADFTLHSFYNGIRNKSFKKRLSLVIKNSIVHLYSDEKLIKHYAELASSFKKVAKSKSVSDAILFIKKGFLVSVPILKLFFFWNKYKMKPYRLAKYQQLFFEHVIGSKKFVIFQTIELLDFIAALNKKSIDKLIKENGLFIGHTYFSVPMDYHDGKIFTNSGKIAPRVEENFKYLGKKIEEHAIWNPTLEELVAHWIEYNKAEFTISPNGTIVLKNETTIPNRMIT